MWWLVTCLALLALIIVWVHSMRGMPVRDRLDAALDIVESSNFAASVGFDEARQEDPDLVGWIRAGQDCVMLFRSQHGPHVREVIDVASGNFRPGLVVHYEDSEPMRSDEGELLDPRHRQRAEALLSKVRQRMRQLHPQSSKEYDGFHY